MSTGRSTRFSKVNFRMLETGKGSTAKRVGEVVLFPESKIVLKLPKVVLTFCVNEWGVREMKVRIAGGERGVMNDARDIAAFLVLVKYLEDINDIAWRLKECKTLDDVAAVVSAL